MIIFYVDVMVSNLFLSTPNPSLDKLPLCDNCYKNDCLLFNWNGLEYILFLENVFGKRQNTMCGAIFYASS